MRTLLFRSFELFACLRRVGARAALVGVACFLLAELPVRGATLLQESPGVGESDRLNFLRREIERHDELYHWKASPEITDAEYDELKRELVVLQDRSSDESRANKTSRKVTSTDDRTSGFTAHSHGVRMLSLDKAYSESDLRRFHDRVVRRLGVEPSYVVEPKFDGVAVSAVYLHGTLVRVLTRGDGSTGDDITENARAYTDIPRKLIRPPDSGRPLPEQIEIRGEVFMSLAEFARVNRVRESAGDDSYASPRNLAAGTLKSLRHAGELDRRLEAVFYGFGKVDSTVQDVGSQQELHEQLEQWGMPTPRTTKLAKSFSALWSATREMRAARVGWSFPSDGVVVKVDSRDQQRALGAHDHAPLWAIAFKFTPERQTTRLRAITLQIGRTGLITPVAELDPIRLGGAMIRRATLHNADEIARRDLRVGDYVVVERGGEIIPAIVGVDLSQRGESIVPFEIPKVCPGCDQSLVRREHEVAWRCVNPRCRPQIIRRVRHFGSAACVGISGLGDVTVAKLVESGKIESVSDLYRLRREDLMEELGVASSDALVAAIDRSRSAELWRIIYGLGIEGVGSRTAQALALQYRGLGQLAAALELKPLLNLKGVNAEVSNNLARFFSSLEGRRIVEVLGFGRRSPSP